MKIFIVGSTGRVGKSLLKSLSTTDYQIYAGARKVEPETLIIASIPCNCLAISSGGKSLLKVDLYGAVKLMQAAEKAEVKRFILLSTIFSLQPEKWIGA
ncbi:SDR family NAD(P)-dependent oxidoreductase, partial [Lactococcus lactis]